MRPMGSAQGLNLRPHASVTKALPLDQLTVRLLDFDFGYCLDASPPLTRFTATCKSMSLLLKFEFAFF